MFKTPRTYFDKRPRIALSERINYLFFSGTIPVSISGPKHPSCVARSVSSCLRSRRRKTPNNQQILADVGSSFLKCCSYELPACLFCEGKKVFSPFIGRPFVRPQLAALPRWKTAEKLETRTTRTQDYWLQRRPRGRAITWAAPRGRAYDIVSYNTIRYQKAVSSRLCHRWVTSASLQTRGSFRN